MLDLLPPRERELLDALFVLEKATPESLRAAMRNAPGNSAVRAMLSRLEAKGYVRRRRLGGRYWYAPAISPEEARQGVLDRVISTFFKGSPIRAATALLGMSDHIEEGELKQLEKIIARARRAGR